MLGCWADGWLVGVASKEAGREGVAGKKGRGGEGKEEKEELWVSLPSPLSHGHLGLEPPQRRLLVVLLDRLLKPLLLAERAGRVMDRNPVGAEQPIVELFLLHRFQLGRELLLEVREASRR